MGTCFGRCFAGKNNNRSVTEDDQQKNLVNEGGGTTTENSFIFRIMRTKQKRHSKFLDRFMARQDLRYSRLNKNNATSIVPSISTTSSTDIQLQCLDAHSLMLTNQHHHHNHQHFDNRNSSYRSDYFSGGATNSSPGSSSLDLEWENEYEQNMIMYGGGGGGGGNDWVRFPEDISTIPEQERDSSGSTDEDDESMSINSKNTSIILPSKHFIKQQLKSKRKQSKNSIINNYQQQYHQHLYRTSSRNSWTFVSSSTPESLEWDINDDEQQLKSEEDSLDHETIDLLHEIEWLKNRALNETGENLRNDATPIEFES